MPPDLPEVAAELDQAIAELTGAINVLRDFAHGIHPATLTRGGLDPALRALVRHSAVPVDLDVRTNGRLPERIETAEQSAAAKAMGFDLGQGYLFGAGGPELPAPAVKLVAKRKGVQETWG